jgi:hypothetical protein
LFGEALDVSNLLGIERETEHGWQPLSHVERDLWQQLHIDGAVARKVRCAWGRQEDSEPGASIPAGMLDSRTHRSHMVTDSCTHCSHLATDGSFLLHAGSFCVSVYILHMQWVYRGGLVVVSARTNKKHDHYRGFGLRRASVGGA